MDLAGDMADPNNTPEEKEILKKKFHELNRRKDICVQKELMAELEPPKQDFFSNLMRKTGVLANKIRSKFNTISDTAFDVLDATYYEALEGELIDLLRHPEQIHNFVTDNYDTFNSLFNCSGPSQLKDAIDLNLEKDFRLVSGCDVTPELKDAFTTLFTEHRQTVDNAIIEVIETQKAQAWENIGHLESEDASELVRAELLDVKGEERIRKFVEVYCKIIGNRRYIDNSPKGIEEAYDDLSFSLYRNLKSEMGDQGIWEKKRYVQNLNFEDDEDKVVQQVWQVVKERILKEMEYDSYL